MHLSVAAFSGGLIPKIYTGAGGNGKNTMVEKCRGMFKNSIGRSDLVASDFQELKSALETLINNSETMRADLKRFNETNRAREVADMKKLREELGIDPQPAVLPYAGEAGQTAFIKKKLRAISESIALLKEEARDEHRLDDLQRQINDLTDWNRNQAAQLNAACARLEELERQAEAVGGIIRRFEKKYYKDAILCDAAMLNYENLLSNGKNEILSVLGGLKEKLIELKSENDDLKSKLECEHAEEEKLEKLVKAFPKRLLKRAQKRLEKEKYEG
jgi:hypothetical protein